MPPPSCVLDVASLNLSHATPRPLHEILTRPVCAHIPLETQARLVEAAMRAELEPLSRFLLRVAALVAAWAALELLARASLARHPRLAAAHATRVEVRQCVVSCAHSLWSLGATFVLLLQMEQPHGASDALRHIPHRVINPIGSVFFAYLLWDLMHVFLNRRVHAKILKESVVHHLCFMGMMLANRTVLWFNYCFPVLYIAELSTFFLSLRVCYKKLDIPEMWVSASFAVTFAVTRVLLMGLLVVHVFRSYPYIRSLLGLSMQLSYLVGLPAMYCLNLYWFSKVLQGMRKTLRKDKVT
ncbi:hypothetical protein AB1Y20_014698 [Prymnesium parvum]|uniref:TLC domain-containing protein n=1 Tax=Prymnesium parvum TaxID=97485 RepID=A0AB34IE38_PRYPA